MKANAWLRLLIVVCALFVTRSAVRSDKKPLLTYEEGDAGSGDTVRKVIEKNVVIPDDTESSGEGEPSDDDTEDDEEGSGGSGSGEGSGYIRRTNGTISPATTQTVVVINNGDGASTTKTKIVVDVTTKDVDPVDINNNVDPDSNNNEKEFNNTFSNVIPDTQKSTDILIDDTGLGNSGVNFTVAIIVGVVVGAILSILIIVFLVYRLRKKDEGSYSLDEQSQTMLRNDADSPPPKGKAEEYNYA